MRELLIGLIALSSLPGFASDCNTEISKALDATKVLSERMVEERHLTEMSRQAKEARANTTVEEMQLKEFRILKLGIAKATAQAALEVAIECLNQNN